MDIYEQLVEVYLTAFERCFVLPQAHAELSDNGKPVPFYEGGKRWNTCPDFVALDFEKHRIQVAEVTKDGDSAKVKNVIGSKLDDKYRAELDRWIRAAVPVDYPIVRRFFARRDVARKLDRHGIEVTCLEDVFDAIREKKP